MEGDQTNYSNMDFNDSNLQIRDLEDKQKLIKDRVLLIGQNLIDTKEKTNKEIINMKKDIELLKQNIERIRTFLETLSGELSKFARKEEVEILSKQARMFQPLEALK